MVFLETQRLVLRNVKDADANVMFDYRNNDICARYQRGQAKGYDEIRDLIRRRQNDVPGVEGNCMLAVALKETDEMIGEIVVLPNDGAITMGYTFSYRHHRRGYAFEAMSALTEMLHEKHPEWEFICFVEPENEPSKGLLRKLGYRNYGYVEKITSNVFGKWVQGDPLK